MANDINDKALAVTPEPNIADIPMDLKSLNLAQIKVIGQTMAQSGMFSDIQSASQAIVKILAGQEIGVAPFQAMTNIHIIKGKATMGANLMAARVKGSGRYDYRVRKQDSDTCEIEFFERSLSDPTKWDSIGVSSFTMADARKAGTQNLEKFGRNMLFARAMSNGTRWYCPDVFNGNLVYTPDELDAEVDSQGEIIDVSAPTAEDQARQAIAKAKTPDEVTDIMNAQPTDIKTAVAGEANERMRELQNGQ